MMAYSASLRSEDPYVRVGAVALTHDGRVIAAGYNGLPQGKHVDPSFWLNRDERRKYIIHAEINVCALIKRGDAETLAVTLSPCASCASAIIAAGFSRVVYANVYDKDSIGLDLLKNAGINLIQIPERKITEVLLTLIHGKNEQR